MKSKAIFRFKAVIGVVFVVASILKLGTLQGIIHIKWLERAAEDPWATYFTTCLLIIVGLSLIYDWWQNKQK